VEGTRVMQHAQLACVTPTMQIDELGAAPGRVSAGSAQDEV